MMSQRKKTGAGEDWVKRCGNAETLGIEMKRNLSMSYILGMKTP